MSSWNHHTTPALGIHCMYCSLLIAQKAQQNRRGQIKGNEIRGRNLGMFGVKKRKKKKQSCKALAGGKYCRLWQRCTKKGLGEGRKISLIKAERMEEGSI